MSKRMFLSMTILCLALLVSFCSASWTASIWEDFLTNGSASQLPDFSYAGYKYGEEPLPSVPVVVDVRDFGAIADDQIDDTQAINQAIKVAATMGGAVYFPAGEFTIDTSEASAINIDIGNVVLRGEGSGQGGTVLKFINMDYDTGEEVVGYVCVGRNRNPDSWGSAKASIVANAMRGDGILEVADANDLAPGEVVHITMKNTGGLANLTEYLISPLEIDPAWTNAYNSAQSGYTYFRWLVEIDSIIDSTHVKLKQPLRENILTVFEPRINRINTIENVGIEDMKIVSDLAIDGGKSEQDYWPRAIVFRNAVNSWVKNVVVENFSIGFNTQFCKNVTFKDIELGGVRGSFGALIWGSDCLVDGFAINSQRRKAITIHNYSQGSVVRNVVCNYTSSGTEYTQGLDYHCNYSLENLMENITNGRSNSSGNVINYPNASHRNTFWNIKVDDLAPSFDPGNEREFFANHWYRSTYSYARKDAHKSMPKSIVVGVYHDSVDIEIEGSDADRDDEWIYVEGLNQSNINPSSLYEAQFALRVGNISGLKADLNNDGVVDIEDFSILASQWLSVEE